MEGVVVISREKKWIGTYRRSRRITCDLELVYFVGLRIMLEAIIESPTSAKGESNITGGRVFVVVVGIE